MSKKKTLWKRLQGVIMSFVWTEKESINKHTLIIMSNKGIEIKKCKFSWYLIYQFIDIYYFSIDNK
jgi:hypothetical protein